MGLLDKHEGRILRAAAQQLHRGCANKAGIWPA